jgi:transcriptional regulator with XRE-family HTH domain
MPKKEVDALRQRAKAWREERGMSQEELSLKVGLAGNSYGKFERGEIKDMNRNHRTRLVAIISGDKTVAPPVARETSPEYGSGQPYLHWLRQVIDSETPYPEKVQAIHDSSVLELKRRPREGKAG